MSLVHEIDYGTPPSRAEEKVNLTIDGHAVTGREFAKLVSFVPQDTALFHRSITDNIAYGSDVTSPERIQEAARQASADEFIRTMPDGYDTLIGERGAKIVTSLDKVSVISMRSASR